MREYTLSVSSAARMARGAPQAGAARSRFRVPLSRFLGNPIPWWRCSTVEKTKIHNVIVLNTPISLGGDQGDCEKNGG